MSPRVFSIRSLLAAGVALGAAASAAAQLSSRSPFISTPAAGAGTAPTAGAPLEFVGYYEDNEGRLFRIRDVTSKKGVWARLNERSDEFNLVVKQHDTTQATLTVEHQGRSLTLAERVAKIVSGGPAMPAMPPPMPVQSNVPAAVTQSVVLNPTPADEQARLNAVASEVARRRALRVQAEQNVNQPPAPQPVMPPANVPAMQPVPNRPR